MMAGELRVSRKRSLRLEAWGKALEVLLRGASSSAGRLSSH